MKEKHSVFKLEDYELACKVAAKLVNKFGDVYLPIFKRTHDELRAAREINALKTIALGFAKE